MAVNWRGVQLDERTAAQMDEAMALAGFDVWPSQGSWSGAAASAGTHSGCGAIDITGMDANHCDQFVAAMRQVGMAAWHRTPEQSDWPRHVHGISVQRGGKYDMGCLHISAHNQVVDYFNGDNGLASHGPDDGPRDWVGVTWETYQQSEPEPGEDDDMKILWTLPSGVAGVIHGDVFCGVGGDEASQLYDAGFVAVLLDDATRVQWNMAGIKGLG